jgi:hypothetical protein
MKTAEKVLEQQRNEGGMPARVPAATPVSTDGSIDAFLVSHAGGGGATFFRFTKGAYTTRDGEEVALKTEFTCPYDAIQVGWIRFRGKGNPPDRHMGPLFGGFVEPPRESLGDQDQTKWELGIDGKPADPWVMQMLVPLVESKTGKLFIFNTTTATGRNAAGKLVFACKTLRRKDPGLYPIIRLDLGGYEHRDSRIGWVKTPAFPIVGQVPKDGTIVPDTTIAGDLDDEIPF